VILIGVPSRLDSDRYAGGPILKLGLHENMLIFICNA
jgi:hypothetical protein